MSSHRKKREAKVKRDVKRGIREPNEQNPFEIFVTVTDIRYTCVVKPHLTLLSFYSDLPLGRYYKDSQKILGSTYGMLVLQDFEALTPNLLARTIETVEGGGLVVLLLKTMSSLRQLYAMTMVCPILHSYLHCFILHFPIFIHHIARYSRPMSLATSCLYPILSLT